MSHFGSRGRGRGGGRGSSRSGLLGPAPGARKPGLLDSLGPLGNQQNQHAPQFQDQHRFEPPTQRQKPGLLGNAPNNWQEPTRGYERPPKHQQYQEPRHEPEYSYQEPEQYSQRGFEVGQRGEDLQEQPEQRGHSESLPPQIQHIMANLGLSKADMEELSRLPEKELSSSNLLQVIKNLRDKKATAARPVPSPHDRAPMQSYQEHGHGRRSFDSRERSPERKALYDPSEPTDDYGNTERYEEQRFAEENRDVDAFSSFQEKWYSDSSKKDERDRGDAQPAGSILRGSRGPVVRVSRWERDDRPAPAKQPRRLSPPQRRSPPPIRRPSPPIQQRRRPSPQRLHSPPRHMSPPPRRLSSPPRMSTHSQMQQHPRGSLLGDPSDPSTQELDLLAATINHSRPQPPQNVFHPPERSYPGPERYHQPMRPRSPLPPPLLQQPTRPPRPDPVLQAQMQAMQVLQSEAITHQAFKPQPMGGRGPPPAARGEKKIFFTKEEAQAEASKMRIEQGRVLYLRYRAGGMDTIREEHLVKLAQPFEKVTNILLVAPKNLETGWYQAFVELADFDGAAAMCEHYMGRPPTVEGITIQVQRSKYKDLKLREHQMNRDFDKLLLRKNEGNDRPRRRQRPASLSPDRSKKKVQKGSPAERRSFSKEKEKKGSTAKKSESNNTKSDKKPKMPDEKPKRNDHEKQNKNASKSKTEPQESKKKKPDSADKKESFQLVDEVGEDGGKKKGTEDRDLKNGTAKAEVKEGGASEGKRKIGGERVEIIRENIEQASNMSEALLKIVQQKSTQAIISEILEYLSDSLDQLKELEKD